MSGSPSFFAELKRRNVYKVAVAYAVVGWLIAQIATQILPFLEIPNWVVRLVIVLIAIGFPIALVIAWAFEATPEGIKRSEIADVMPATARQKKHAWIYVIVIAAAISGGLFFLGRYAGSRTPRQSEAATVPSKSIAVLPFENLSSDKENAYFAEGIQDEILTRLSKIVALKVISRTSTEKYKSAPDNLREIGKQLGVAHLLEGSVQRIGNAVHINVQLIRAESDEHLWAESYNRQLDDVFGVEGEVATAIADQLRATLTGAEKQELASKLTTNPAAHDAYLRGMSQILLVSPDDMRRASAFFAEAVRLDPNFVAAWADLSRVKSRMYQRFVDRTEALKNEAKEAADTAVRLDPNSGEGYFAQGVYRYRILGDFDGALAAFTEAQHRLPNDSQVLQFISFIKKRQGKWPEAIDYLQRALVLDPRDANAIVELASDYEYLRKFSEARTLIDRALSIIPTNPLFLALKGETYQSEGNLDAASQLLDPLPLRPEDTYVFSIRLRQFYFRREFEKAKAALTDALAKPRPSLGAYYLAAWYGSLSFVQGWTGDHAAERETCKHWLEQINLLRGSEAASAAEIARFSAQCYAGLGDKAVALREARAAIEANAQDAVRRADAEINLAQIQAYLGDADAAIEALPHLLEMPAGLTPAELRLDPFWDPLRKDPRFKTLIAQPQAK
jgi:TolB-like protein/Tfp pilus assembly protein PilF